jgi:hypothetical protein
MSTIESQLDAFEKFVLKEYGLISSKKQLSADEVRVFTTKIIQSLDAVRLGEFVSATTRPQVGETWYVKLSLEVKPLEKLCIEEITPLTVTFRSPGSVRVRDCYARSDITLVEKCAS